MITMKYMRPRTDSASTFSFTTVSDCTNLWATILLLRSTVGISCLLGRPKGYRQIRRVDYDFETR